MFKRFLLLLGLLALISGCQPESIDQPILIGSSESTDALLVDAWLPTTVPVIHFQKNNACTSEQLEAAVNLWMDAGQELEWKFVDSFGAWFQDGIINIRVQESPQKDHEGIAYTTTTGHSITAAYATVDHCEPWLLGHEIGHVLGFGHSSDSNHLMGIDGTGTFISSGEIDQLESR